MQYVTIIEWDGKAPSTRYYQRMHRLGLYVRGDKSQSPIARRHAETSEGSGVIVQEGAVVCASLSLARTVASYAEEDGAKVVMIGTAADLEPHQITNEDVAVLAGIDAILGKRGRPSEEKFDIVLTCLEEAETFQYDEISDKLVNCPNCHATKIRKRAGRMNVYRPIRDTDDLFSYWLGTRFATGLFEKPLTIQGTNDPKVDPKPGMPYEAKAAETIQKSTRFLADLEKSCRDKALAVKYLDYAFVARTVLTEDQRLDSRIRAITKLIQAGFNPLAFSLAENPDEIDLFDLSYYVPTVDLWARANI